MSSKRNDGIGMNRTKVEQERRKKKYKRSQNFTEKWNEEKEKTARNRDENRKEQKRVGINVERKK